MVLEKCGFTKEGAIFQGKMVSTWCDYHLYAILKTGIVLLCYNKIWIQLEKMRRKLKIIRKLKASKKIIPLEVGLMIVSGSLLFWLTELLVGIFYKTTIYYTWNDCPAHGC